MPTKLANKLQHVSPETVGVVCVDLGAIQRNYTRFAQYAAPTKISPVIKANAYGLGMVKVAGALSRVGAQEFFVATIQEGIDLKQALPQCDVFVFYGLYFNTAEVYYTNKIIPVLNTLEQALNWSAFAQSKNEVLQCAIHLDTGMSRTGLTYKEGCELVKHVHALSHINILYVMSHLSCSEVVDNPLNQQQLNQFNELAQQLPANTPKSLTATPIMNMPDAYKMDMARVGYGLYGFCHSPAAFELEQALYIYSRIVQLRDVVPGDTVGYGATYVVEKEGGLATISIGYADGYHRFLHNYNTYVYIGPYRAYLVGRISMDFCVVDVSHIPKEYIFEGAWVQMVGPDIRVADLIQGTDFVPHEIPISAGKRYHWEYLD